MQPGIAMRALVVAIVLLVARSASAHQTSWKYVDLSIEDNVVEVRLRFAPGDVTEPMGLANDATPPIADAVKHPAVAPYVQRWLVISAHDGPCTPSTPAISAADAKFVAVTWTVTCGSPTRELRLDLAAFFALDQRHEAVIRLVAPHAEPIQAIIRAGESPATLRAGHSPSLLAWIRTGMDHIYGGLDHILFVIALLLVVMLYRLVPTRGPSSWHRRAFVPTLKSTAIVVTAFTIAHSISLIAAALGWVELDSQLVESLIALSIAYTAAEDIVRPDVRWRYWMTFAFGLVHGLGFASQLAVLLPPRDVVVPLLCFNLGVEIGQLSIVIVALPVFSWLVRALGADRYRRIALPITAGAIFLIGLTMFVERVFEVSILPI